MRKVLAVLAVLAVAVALPIAVAGAAVSVTVVVDYDPALGELPEGVAVDKRGDVFTSLSHSVRSRRSAAAGRCPRSPRSCHRARATA